MLPEVYLEGLKAERANAVRAGRTDIVKQIDAEIRIARAGIREVENAMRKPEVETR
jgi:hypothetical protein